MIALKRQKGEKFVAPTGPLPVRTEAIVIHELGNRRFQVERVEVRENVEVDKVIYDLEIILHANGRSGSALLQKDLVLGYEGLNADLLKVLRDRISVAFKRLYPEWSPLTPFGKPY